MKFFNHGALSWFSKRIKIKYCWNSALSSEGLQHSLMHPLRHTEKPRAPAIGWLRWGVTYGVHRARSQVPDSQGAMPAFSSSSCVPTGIWLSFSGSLFSICNIGMVLLPLSHRGIVRIRWVVDRTLRTAPREFPICPVVRTLHLYCQEPGFRTVLGTF